MEARGPAAGQGSAQGSELPWGEMECWRGVEWPTAKMRGSRTSGCRGQRKKGEKLWETQPRHLVLNNLWELCHEGKAGLLFLERSMDFMTYNIICFRYEFKSAGRRGNTRGFFWRCQSEPLSQT
jgi:hypothetical protein